MKFFAIVTITLVSHFCGNSCFSQERQGYYDNHLVKSRLESSRIKNQLAQLQRKTSSKLLSESSIKMEQILKADVPQYLTEWQSGASKKWSISKILGRNMFKYALSVSAIGAGTALLRDFSETGEIRPYKALDFLTDSQFFKSSLGIFVGSTMLSTLGNFLPAGIGPILKTVPSFLGAALGYEWSQGNLGNLDWAREGLSAIASSAAFIAFGGGGLIAIAGGVIASMLSDQLYDTFKAQKSPSLRDSGSNQTVPKSTNIGMDGKKIKTSPPYLHLRKEILRSIQDNLANENLDQTRENLENLQRISGGN